MFLSVIQNKIKSAPKEPGCYIFSNQSGILYVGKANNLRNRLNSYLQVKDMKTESLQEEATNLELIVFRSEVEALIQESQLIKNLKPKYNILWRDDKSYLYIHFTKEKFPKILIGHQKLKPRLLAMRHSLFANPIGPFTDGASLRLVMNIIRRHFPYCTCTRGHLRDCLNAQIEKCLGFCCKKNQENQNIPEYSKNIRIIKAILRGKNKKLLPSLINQKEKEALTKIFAHQNFLNPTSDFQILNPKPYALSPAHIECYDISNLSGKETVGAMTSLKKENGVWVSDKNSYRKFKIQAAPSHDDPRAIAEILQRRLRHSEWQYPDLILIDGGITQFRAAKKVLSVYNNLDIKLISFAKPNQLVYGLKENDLPTSIVDLPKEFQQLIRLAIHQTHNFVIRYHRQTRNRKFLPVMGG